MDILAEFVKAKSDTRPAYTPGLHRRVRRTDAPPAQAVDWQPLDEFRRTMAGALRTYMQTPDPDHMLLIPAPPGSGKTWAGVEFAHWVSDTLHHRLLYAGPRRDFFADVAATSVRQNANIGQWYEWLARRTDTENPRQHTCNYGDAINEWLSLGYEGMDFCSSVCGWNWVNGGCRYHAQKDTRERLIYGAHAHVTLGHPLAKEFACVVGDELPIAAFVHEWTIPARRVQVRGMAYDTGLAALLHDLSRLCDMKPSLLHGAALIEALGGAGRLLSIVDDSLLTLFASATIITPTIPTSGDISHVAANYLPVLLPILRREAEAAQAGMEYPSRLLITTRGLTILTRRSVNEQMPRHIIWFDATGTAPLYEAMFNRPVETLTAQPKPAGRIHQIVDRANGKGSLVQRNESGEQSETTRAHQLRIQIDAIAAQYQRPGVITHMALKETIQHETRHFYGNRGTNEFEDCDCLIVAGTPQPPLYQIEKTARCLWPERMTPFVVTTVTVERAYSHTGDDGAGFTYPVAQFLDADLNVLLEQYREMEIVQAAHRSRLLFRDTDVFLLTNIPIPQLPIARLLTIKELLSAPDATDAFLWQRVQEFVNRQDVVTAGDLVAEFGIHADTAKRYLALFVAQGWQWIEGIRRPGSRGPAPKTIGRAT